MDIETLQSFLLWCLLINYMVLVIWLVFRVVAGQWAREFYGRLFGITEEQFNWANFFGMLIFKLGILLFNLTPYIALRIAAG